MKMRESVNPIIICKTAKVGTFALVSMSHFPSAVVEQNLTCLCLGLHILLPLCSLSVSDITSISVALKKTVPLFLCSFSVLDCDSPHLKSKSCCIKIIFLIFLMCFI